MQAGIQAKAAGQLIEVTDPAKMAGCRDLGDRYEETSVRGARGRLELRSALKSKGRARGASHVRYSDYAVLDFNGQGERGHFYDCALTGLLPPTTTPGTPGASGATGAPGRAWGSGSTRAPVAEGAGAPAASVSASAGAGAAGTHAPTLMLTGQLELLPVGALQSKVNDQSLETATGMAYGVSGSLEILLTPYLAVGLNPGVTLGLKTDMATAAAKQFDLRARARLGTLAVEGFGAYLYGAGGLSWIVLPNDGKTSGGAVVGVGAGVTHHVERSTFVAFELGYQFGFQNRTVADIDVEHSSQLFHFGFAIGWDL